jgi:hypothetical protein
MGAIDLMGWVTKVTEYKSATTMKQRMQVTAMTTNPQTLTSISSGVRFCFWLDIVDLFFKNWCDQVFWTHLGKQTLWLLTFWGMEVVRILALVSIPIFAASEHYQSNCDQIFHTLMSTALAH